MKEEEENCSQIQILWANRRMQIGRNELYYRTLVVQYTTAEFLRL